MKKIDLRTLIFMTLCCDLGLCAKKLIAPAANVITEFLHIPGGIATGFSLMFLVIAASLIPVRSCALIMSVLQSILALCFGMTGSMGILAPIGYILPGIVIDSVMFFSEKFAGSRRHGILAASILSSAAACLAADFLIFRLHGLVLTVYVLVAVTSGSVFGLLAQTLSEKLRPVILMQHNTENTATLSKKEIS
ncbi:hypothetical protein [[Clostridium] aminophilum]|uniref:Energy-coupling factor transport system substrate-specific component n=1 Tax=[Clostridium] aminophilum TaxID=1526 RepID=A0A1I6I9Z9_9FIRM|nr:hypothetical protein [[Clostridium] aminophilum]SFR63526.1 hypothetical protein SAMN02910262_00087 [[Clostridium] aminophilum]